MAANRLDGPATVSILLYHAIGSPTGRPSRADRRFCVSPDAFDAHLRAIADSGLPVLSLAAAHGSGGGGVTITFDDGGVSDYERALPALQSAGMPATFFVNPANMGRAGFMDWTQARALAGAGMEIQSHGWHHTDFTRLNPRVLLGQLRFSRMEIEDRIGRPVAFAAAPFGALNRAVIDTAIAAGYTAVCSSANRAARPGERELPRLAVYARNDATHIARLVRGDWRVCRLRQARHFALAPVRFCLRWAQAATPGPTPQRKEAA